MSDHNPVQVLMDEHEIISSVNEIIDGLDKLWETEKDSYTQKVTSLLKFFSEYSDKFHHQKEEKILFKELRDNPDFLLDEILEELEGHHEDFRDTVQQISGALDNEAFDEVQQLLQNYMSDLLDHIAVENDELFIMAETLFSEDELERMYFLFEDLDRELGQQNKEQLVNDIKEM